MRDECAALLSRTSITGVQASAVPALSRHVSARPLFDGRMNAVYLVSVVVGVGLRRQRGGGGGTGLVGVGIDQPHGARELFLLVEQAPRLGDHEHVE